jgi:hypothetical protein
MNNQGVVLSHYHCSEFLLERGGILGFGRCIRRFVRSWLGLLRFITWACQNRELRVLADTHPDLNFVFLITKVKDTVVIHGIYHGIMSTTYFVPIYIGIEWVGRELKVNT